MSYSGSFYGHYGPSPSPGGWPPPYQQSKHPMLPSPTALSYSPTQYPQPYYVPGTMMIPVVIPVAQPPPPETRQVHLQPKPKYITNYIFKGAITLTTDVTGNDNKVFVAECSCRKFSWVPTTTLRANSLTGRAVVGGHDDAVDSPLWVIRSWHNGDLMPGKLSVRHNSASIVCEGKEISVHDIEVLCAKPEDLRWVPASNGDVPCRAIPGGRTASGETLYVGRASNELSVTPGKIHPSHNSCYIGFAGQEVAHKMYDVLCTID